MRGQQRGHSFYGESPPQGPGDPRGAPRKLRAGGRREGAARAPRGREGPARAPRGPRMGPERAPRGPRDPRGLRGSGRARGTPRKQGRTSSRIAWMVASSSAVRLWKLSNTSNCAICFSALGCKGPYRGPYSYRGPYKGFYRDAIGPRAPIGAPTIDPRASIGTL